MVKIKSGNVVTAMVQTKRSRRKRLRTHGFLKRSRTRGGARVLLRRRRKKRKLLTPRSRKS